MLHTMHAYLSDVYAVTEKKQKKKEPTEAELAQMYSIPDKTKGGGVSASHSYVQCVFIYVYYVAFSGKQ